MATCNDPIVSADAQPSESTEAQSGIRERTLLDRIDDERAQLRGILGSLRCLEVALEAQNPPDCDEIGGALAIAREELRNVIDRLDEINLLRASHRGAAIGADEGVLS